MAELKRDLADLLRDLADLRRSFATLKWMMALTVLLTLILLMKVFSDGGVGP